MVKRSKLILLGFLSFAMAMAFAGIFYIYMGFKHGIYHGVIFGAAHCIFGVLFSIGSIIFYLKYLK